MTWNAYRDALLRSNPQLGRPGKMKVDIQVFMECLQRAYDRGRRDERRQLSEAGGISDGEAVDFLKGTFGL